MNDLTCADDCVLRAVDEYSDTIYRVALNITKNSDDAFDVCQDVFVRLIKNKHKIKNGEHLKAWLIHTAVNCSKSFVTSPHIRRCVPLDEAQNKSVSDVTGDIDLFEAVNSLSSKYSVAVYLFYYEDMKLSDIAKVLNITESAVKSRLRRARKMLKLIIEKEKSYD